MIGKLITYDDLEKVFTEINNRQDTMEGWLVQLLEKLGYEAVGEEITTIPAHLRKIKKRK